MKKHLPVAISIVMMLLLISALPLPAQENMKPSEAWAKAVKLGREDYTQYVLEHKTNPDLTYDFENAFPEIIRQLLPSVQKEGLNDPNEQFFLAQLYAGAKQDEKALALYDTVAAGDGFLAKQASVGRLLFLVEKNRYELIEPFIIEHQRRFTYAVELKDFQRYFLLHIDYIYALDTYVEYLVQQGKHEAAVDLITREIDRLPNPLRLTYRTPYLVGRYLESFTKLNRREEAVKIMEHYLAAYKDLDEEKSAHLPEEGDDERTKRAWELAEKERKRGIQILQAQLTRATLIGKAAPSIEFSRVYNAPNDLTFVDLKGKVILIDFWTNWCGPCKRVFPSLKQLYTEYEDKGLVILSVTGLQGCFYDEDIELQSVEPEEEYRLTEKLIERYGMTWPVVFSEHGAFDPEYGVRGVPTLVTLDRKGMVHEIKVGFEPNEADILRQIIEKLLAE